MYAYGFIKVFTIFLLFIYLRGVNLSIPFTYTGDTVLNMIWIKAIIEHGWYIHNPSIGAPFGSDMNDFPMADNASFFIMKVISCFTSNVGLVMNLFYLLSYPLTVLTSFYVMRYLRLSVPVSILGSVLYAFLPYHYLRGESHLFLGTYYMIPLIVMVILWVWEHQWSKSRYTASAIILAIVASTGIYYAFFTCVLIALVALIQLYNYKKLKILIPSVIMVLIILLVGLINVSPSIIYSAEHGKNQTVANRSFAESEVYGLKLTSLLLPVNDHRINRLADIKNKYNTSTPLNNENAMATLGIIGSIGFLILVASLFIKHHDETIRKISILNISSFLVASIGGFGTLIAMLILPEIRGYNRISVFIAFFSLVAFCVLLDKWKSNYKYAVVIMLLFVGLYDQTGTNFKLQNEYYRNQYAIDERFVAAIEKSVPPSSNIFQLPYMPFPEHGPIHNMADYDPAKPYIHSRTLKWSYGAMKGREGDIMIHAIAAKPMDEMISEIKKNGYAGIYFERNGFVDKKVEDQLTARLGTPIESENKTSIFYKLP